MCCAMEIQTVSGTAIFSVAHPAVCLACITLMLFKDLPFFSISKTSLSFPFVHSYRSCDPRNSDMGFNVFFIAFGIYPYMSNYSTSFL